MARLVLVDSKRPKPNASLAAHRASASEGEAARRLLEDQGFTCKSVTSGTKGKQFACLCPFHEGPGEIARNKGANFYVHAETSVYFCQSASCGERGNLRTLERHFGIAQDDSDDYVAAYKSREEKLKEFERALTTALRTPFYEHGLTDQTIERFRLGYEPEHPHPTTGNMIPGRYVIPYLEGRRPKFFRYYQPDGDPKWKYTWEEGAQATLFNAHDAMGDKAGRVVICEGEQKAMLLVQLGYAAVAVPGAAQWRDEFQAAFTHARHIVICYDNDNPEHHIYDKPEKNQRCQKCLGKGLDRCIGHNPGQEAALQRLENLGWRAKNVVLPLPEGKDVRKTDINDFFMRDGGTNLDFAQLATGKRATAYKVQSLAEISVNPPEQAHFLIEQGILPVGGRLLIAGKPKVGKAQPLSTPVLTPHGWVAMGDLKPGNLVVGADGESVKVRQIHPQGEMEIFRVTMSDGSSTECTGEHLWQVQSHNDRVAQKSGRVLNTVAIAEMLDEGRVRDTYVPMVEPVEFLAFPKLPLDPYGLGILISASLVSSTPTLRASHLAEPLREAFPDTEVRVTASGAVNLTGGGQRANPLSERLRALGLLGTRTWERFIPAPYLLATIEERLCLLQGLMDGSGWPQSNRSGNTSAVISTSSEQLRTDIVALVQSLGGVARVRHKERPKHQGGFGRPSWTVTLRLPGDMAPFHEPDKLGRWQNGRTSKNTQPTRRIVKIEAAGKAEVQCITVDSDEGLYVTSEYIVTHNSIFVDNLALSLAAGIPFLKRFKVDHPTRTMLLDRELSKWSLFKRLNDLTDDRPGYKAAAENILIDHDHMIRLDQPNAYDTLLQLVEQNGAEVVILDTAYKFFGGDVESSSSLMKGFEVLDKLLHETGCSIVLTHHLKKSQGSGGGKKENNDVADPDNVAGSFLWTGWPNATILLNYLNRSVENPFNSVATFTAFRDHAAPEPLALYRDRSSIAYSAIQDFSHDESVERAPIETSKPTTEAIATSLLELCPTTEDEFLHVTAARYGVSIQTIRPYYIDAMSSGNFEKTSGRPPIIKYKYAGPDTVTWEAEHGLPERPIPDSLGESFVDVPLFDAASGPAGVTP